MSLGCVYPDSLCQNLTQREKIARLSERDVAYDASMDQVYVPGIDLNSALFPRTGYNRAAIDLLRSLMDAGFRRLYLDVYWNSNPGFGSWFLCPQPFVANVSIPTTNTSTNTSSTISRTINSTQCDPSLTVTSLLEGIGDYITHSDTNVAVGLIYLHLRPKVWSTVAANSSVNYGPSSITSSLNNSLVQGLGSRIFTPGDLQSTRSSGSVTELGTYRSSRSTEWPTLRYMLLSMTRRVVVTIDEGTESVGNAANLQNLAFSFSTIPTNDSIVYLASQSFVDHPGNSTSEWTTLRSLGISPVLNTPMSDANMLELLETNGYWSWANNQPQVYSQQQRIDMNKQNHYVACAVFGQDGFRVADCSDHYRVLCRRGNAGYDWQLSDDTNSYYDPDCPAQYKFSLPRTPLEARFVRNLLAKEMGTNESAVAWVDLNSLFLPNCWVSGGTLSVCPYNVVQGDRNGVASLTIAGTAALCMIVAMILLEWNRASTPLRREAKRPKQSPEPEGVPS